MSPRNFSLVKLVDGALGDIDQHPFRPELKLMFLGEIANMPGHCAVLIIGTGQIIVGYHTDNFVELTDEET